ncbi:MAG TPA: glycosyltransferase family 9 protein [Gemmatimonadaceae bacterium]|nr:glycosyltransferase family 9 protein [Gemmatimonadaceae bacterium]
MKLKRVPQFFEDMARTAFMLGLRHLMAKRRWTTLPPDWDAAPRRVLWVRSDAVGDMILSLGVMRAIVAAHPNTTFDVLTNEKCLAVLDGVPFVRHVSTYHERRWWRDIAMWVRLRRARYDAVIDALVLRKRVNTSRVFLLLATGSRYRIGMTGRPQDFIYSVPVAPGNPIDPHVEYLGRLALPFGVDPATTDLRPEIPLGDAERAHAEAMWEGTPGDGLRLLVNLSAAHPERRWPDERFVETVRRARAAWPDARILVIALPPDRRSAELVAGAARGIAACPPLRETMAIVAAADVVFTPDTAVVHIASAFRRTTVGLFRKDYFAWVPYRTPGRAVFGNDPLVLHDLPVEPAAAALLDALRETSLRRTFRIGVPTPAPTPGRALRAAS